MDLINSEQLVARYLAGDDSALKELVAHYSPLLFRFVVQIGASAAEAEDIVQDTFIKVWKNIRQFKVDKKFRPWLYRIARNTTLDYWRQSKSGGSVNIDDVDEDQEIKWQIADNRPTSWDILVQKENSASVLRAVAKLPEIYRTVLNLYYTQQYSLAEIAEILSDSVDTVKSRHRRALAKLRIILGQDDSLRPIAPK